MIFTSARNSITTLPNGFPSAVKSKKHLGLAIFATLANCRNLKKYESKICVVDILITKEIR